MDCENAGPTHARFCDRFLLAQKFERRTFLNRLRLATIPVSVAGLYEAEFHTQLRPVTVAKVHGQLAHA